MESGALNGARRERELTPLAGGEGVDVLVIGGGVTGTGVALDAASRGLSVALCERRDLATGTSRYSSKLIHGGLRYLASGSIDLAWHCARERAHLLATIAPHLVRPIPFVWPLDAELSRPRRVAIRIALELANVLRAAAGSSRRRLPRPRRISAPETIALLPEIATTDLAGGLLYFDAQVEDDARLTVALARTAASHGARVLTYCHVERIDGASASVRDALTGSTFELRARRVVNATGVWAEELSPGVRLQPSKGSHLVVPAAKLGHPSAVMQLLVPDDPTRAVLAVPISGDRVLLGLTDEPYEGAPSDSPEVTPEEEAFLLETISRPLRVPLRHEDVIARFAGLRPLLVGPADRTSDLSRRHRIDMDPATGVITLVGGKLTTYRQMAEGAVDRLAADFGAGASRTERIPLVGAGASPVGVSRRLVNRYGAEAAVVARLAVERPALAEAIGPPGSATAAEIAFALEAEGALTVADVVERRLRLDLEPVGAERARELAQSFGAQVSEPNGANPHE
jgi:glycerol-3-phosphate dehydrogenase